MNLLYICCQIFLLSGLCLCTVPFYLSASNNISIITNGTTEREFSKWNFNDDFIFLPPEQTEINFQWYVLGSYSYIFSFRNNATLNTNLSSPDLPPTGVAPTMPTTFNVQFNCEFTEVIHMIYLFTFYNSIDLEMVYFQFDKDCRRPGCAQCLNNGVCNEILGECVCPDDYFGDSCQYRFTVSQSQGLCPNDQPIASWSIPEEDSTPFDWIGIYSVDTDFTTELPSRYYWFYLGCQCVNPSDKIASEGSSPLQFSTPGRWYIYLFRYDAYYIIAQLVVDILPWEECNTPPCTNSSNCDSHGECINSTCVCNTGYFWQNCSRGCDGLVVYNSSSGVITDGSGDRYHLGKINCSWLVSPSNKFTFINITIADIYVSQPIKIYDFSDQNQTLDEIDSTQLGTSRTYYLDELLISYSVPSDTGSSPGFTIYFSTYLDPTVITWIRYSDPLSIAILILLILALLFAFVTLVITVWKRTHYILVVSTYTFCLLITAGSIVGLCTIFTLIGKPHVYDCVFRMWLLSLAFIFVFGCMFTKNYRIYRIFSNKKVQVRPISDLDLFKIIGLLVAYEVIYLIIWTAVDTPHVTLERDTSEVNTKYLWCTWKISVFPIISVFGKAILMIWGIFLSYQTRKAKTFYRESKYLGFAIYNCFLCFLIVISIVVIFSRYHMLYLAIASFGILFLFGGTLGIVYARIYYYLIFHPKVPPASATHSMKDRAEGNSSKTNWSIGESNEKEIKSSHSKENTPSSKQDSLADI